MDLQSLLSGQVVLTAFVFARFGSALMFMPGFGEAQIAPRIRLSLALVLSLSLAPATPVPALPADDLLVLALLATEATIGVWIGVCARILLSSLHFAGSQIGYASGLANAFAPGLGAFEGATAIAGFLLVAAIATIFATDTHHLIIRALLHSYTILPFGGLMIGDMAKEITRVAAGSLRIGATLAAPFFVMGVLLNLGLGLANRMLPSLPVFFVASAGLIGIGFLVLAVATPAILEQFVLRFGEWLGLLTF